MENNNNNNKPFKNTPCNTNAQFWYYTNRVQHIKNEKNPIIKAAMLKALIKYMNGNGRNILDN